MNPMIEKNQIILLLIGTYLLLLAALKKTYRIFLKVFFTYLGKYLTRCNKNITFI